ncbi:unnamed protein product [Euphydryas editha]|uniref:Reverse transcriptase domain-containing protein n=1 Tax=Euphydryas editha TaxID=104508 RepID=A0AAU9TZU7_EUPED|nr:unnamed protein product [Euphydryas editha]
MEHARPPSELNINGIGGPLAERIIPLKGVCVIPWSYKNITYNLKFAIADMVCASILEYKSCEMLGLVKRIYSIDMSNYDDVFKGLGCLPGKYRIVVDQTVAPVICASRKIPHSLRDRLKVKLEKIINCASEVFHGKLKQFLEDLDGVENYIDDIIVWGETKEIHDKRLKALLERARQINLRFNKDKCRLFVEEVKYVGHVFSVKGMRADNEKIKAITEMQAPKDGKDLERFLGAVNFLSKFIPNYSKIAIPLTNLLKKDNSWRWEYSDRNAFKNLKKAVTSSSVLALYDPSQPVVKSVDASHEALGAVLSQKRSLLLLIVFELNNCKMNSLTSYTVINNMKEIFARFQIPSIVITDNGTQYSSRV